MDIDSIMTKFNPMVVRLLESRLHGLLSRGLMVVHVEGIKSGKRYKIPVGYQRQKSTDGSEHCLTLVSKAGRKNWWKNYRTEVSVDIMLAGSLRSGLAALVDKQSPMFEQTVNQTFQKLPMLAKQFGIRYNSKQGLSDKDLAAVSLDAEMLLIKL